MTVIQDAEMHDYDDIDGYTLTQLYAILQANGVTVETHMLNWISMIKAIIENNIHLPAKPINDDEPPLWEVSFLADGIYAIEIYHPVKFCIMQGDILIAPDERSYTISSIELHNDICHVVLSDNEINEQRILPAQEIVFCFDSEQMQYTTSKWLDSRNI
jgi:hypothetical protein